MEETPRRTKFSRKRSGEPAFRGPLVVTDEATVAEMDGQGKLIVLHKGTNQWTCFPGDENVIRDVPMSLDPMGMQWYMDHRARKPNPTNTSPGLIYKLCGATQRSYTDLFDTTTIPIGPHRMILWPFDAKAAGLTTITRDAGTMVMFAGTPWAHLHTRGSPWERNEYQPGDRAMHFDIRPYLTKPGRYARNLLRSV